MATLRKFRFGSAERIGNELIAVLRRVGVPPEPGSSLDRMVQSTAQIMARARGEGQIARDYDVRPEYSDMAALAELGVQLVRASQNPSFTGLKPHLELLNTGEASQNRRASVRDQAANKIFELVTACYAMQWSENVELDHPFLSDGTNPDVISVLEERRLGIACKVPHSAHPQTLIDRVVDGLDQVDRGECDHGFVFLSLKNVLNRNRYWPGEQDESGAYSWGALPDFQTPLAMLKQELDSIRASLVAHVDDPEVLRNLFKDRKASPVIVFSAHVMCSVMVDGAPAGAMVRMPYVIEMGPVSPIVRRRLEDLNRIMQAIPED